MPGRAINGATKEFIRQLMINWLEGKIDLGAKVIGVASDRGELDALAEQGLIEKRTDAGGGLRYFYVEIVAEGMRFGVSISVQDKKTCSLALHCLDGPCTGKGWDGVSDELLREEYRLLLRLVQKNGGGLPDNKQESQSTWHFELGASYRELSTARLRYGHLHGAPLRSHDR